MTTGNGLGHIKHAQEWERRTHANFRPETAACALLFCCSCCMRALAIQFVHMSEELRVCVFFTCASYICGCVLDAC